MAADNKSTTNLKRLEHARKLVIILLDLAILAQKNLLDAYNFLSLFECAPDSIQFAKVRWASDNKGNIRRTF